MIIKFNLTEDEIQSNYQETIKFVGEFFDGDRKKKILHMFSENELGLEMATAPASGTQHFHLAVPGGYNIHVMNVVKNSFGQKKLFELGGGKVDWNDEEMVFSSLFHDLGKLGTKEEGSQYVPQTDDWKARKGEVYKFNGNLPYMEVTDRSVYLLQKYGITYDWKEFLSIRLSDGIYNEANKKYLIQYNPDMVLKTTLPKIVHLADYLSCFTEYNLFINQKSVENL
jgi:hypothetical protein